MFSELLPEQTMKSTRSGFDWPDRAPVRGRPYWNELADWKMAGRGDTTSVLELRLLNGDEQARALFDIAGQQKSKAAFAELDKHPGPVHV